MHDLLDARTSKPLEGGASYSIRHRIARALWNVTWSLLASWTPTPFHWWRIFLLRCFGAKVPYSCHVYASARVWYPQNLVMEEYSCLGPRVNCYSMAKISLGERAIVSQGAYLCAGTHDIEDENFQLVTKPITIERDAWVAAEAFIGPGVAIGEGAVIGARAVVFRSAEPFGVYVGNPAKLIRHRRKAGLI